MIVKENYLLEFNVKTAFKFSNSSLIINLTHSEKSSLDRDKSSTMGSSYKVFRELWNLVLFKTKDMLQLQEVSYYSRKIL